MVGADLACGLLARQSPKAPSIYHMNCARVDTFIGVTGSAAHTLNYVKEKPE